MDTPVKFYYDFDGNRQITADGSQVANANLIPQATLGAKPLINVQLLGKSGTSWVNYTGLAATVVANFMVDSDYVNAPFPIPVGSASWANPTGSEYSKPVLIAPESVYFNDVAAAEGTAGSLDAGEYAYNAETETLTVRLLDSTSPATKDDDYVTIVAADSTSTTPFIECASDNFNQTGTWWDTVTEAFRDPDITAGELSFSLNANTVQFYLRIGSLAKKEATAEMQFFNSSSVLIAVKKMTFICYNRIVGSSLDTLELAPTAFYTRAESDARYRSSDDALMFVVDYGTDANTAKPVGYGRTAWFGSSGVVPVNAESGDILVYTD